MLYDATYMWNLKRNDTNELTYKREIVSQRMNFKLLGGRMRGQDREFGMDMYTLLYLKWITNKDLLYSTANSAQRYVAACMGGEFGGNVCICMAEYVCVYIHTSIYINTCVYIHINTCVYIHINMCVYIHINMCVFIYI